MKIEDANTNIILEKVKTPTKEVATSQVQNLAITGTLENVDVVSIKNKRKNSNTKSTEETNKAISIVNLAFETTDKIDNLFKGVQGIVEQVANSDLSSNKVDVLQTEANALLSNIRSLANESEYEGVKPLTGEDAKCYIEGKIGAALDIVFPDDAKDSFGIETVDFSRKDSIINTLAIIKLAEVRLHQLKNAVEKNTQQIEEIMKTNGGNTIKQEINATPDEAIKLTNDLSQKITEEKDGAIFAMEKPSDFAVELIK